MQLRSLSIQHYAIFEAASFDLTANPSQPIVLFTGNNGAGKTSLLEALRLALHGRRAFDVPLGESEYIRTMTGRFHLSDLTRPCSVALEFDHVDLHRTRTIRVVRSWVLRRQNVAEELRVTVDGKALPLEDAEDLLTSVVPPEVARYFFFDAERIRELAEWDVDDESALFAAVEDLLGLGMLDQLRVDLLRLSASDGKGRRRAEDAFSVLAAAEAEAGAILDELRTARKLARRLTSALDRARSEVRRVGALAQDEFAALETELAQLQTERRGLHEEATRAAGDVLPLLCARTLRRRFGKELASRRRLEEREIVTTFLGEHAEEIRSELRAEGFKPADARAIINVLSGVARGPLVPVSTALPNLSRADALWMERVIERELPEMAKRNREIVGRLRKIDARIETLENRKRSVPKNDPASETALATLEARQRDLLEHEALLESLGGRLGEAERRVATAQDAAKSQRLEAFREGRLKVRERLTGQVLDALPVLSARLKASKEQRFARYLGDALRGLWNKTDRLTDVHVSFADRRIALFDAHGEIRKKDLSAGEKQLFAIAFIHALARLSGRQMPFVIDTPLGRLDRQHRRRFVSEFLPSASHQIVLLSTDTEIVGELYRDLKPFVARHHELAGYNGGATAPVEMVSA